MFPRHGTVTLSVCDTRNLGTLTDMLMNALIVALIVVAAVILGIIVHPLLWFILILAAVWLFTRVSRRSHA
jgi:hypothetical protein